MLSEEEPTEEEAIDLEPTEGEHWKIVPKEVETKKVASNKVDTTAVGRIVDSIIDDINRNPFILKAVEYELSII
ncbi:MAG TPA: hypothetical protein VJ438_05270 [Candidatus Nanoarchaeia archaeon]|nr:hypothetical protein [Candidatus Nanoarchaeia archaeon]